MYQESTIPFADSPEIELKKMMGRLKGLFINMNLCHLSSVLS